METSSNIGEALLEQMDKRVSNDVTPSTEMVKCVKKCSHWRFNVGWQQKDTQRAVGNGDYYESIFG
jgi:hypothetical protein